MAGYRRDESTGREMLDLAFNIDLAEGIVLCNIEKCSRFAGEKSKSVFSLFEKGLAVVIVDKLCSVAI